MKPAIRSALAEQDVAATVDFYLDESPPAALGFVRALEQAVRHIEAHPASGSPRYAHELDIPQLRHWPLHGYPYALFYIEHADHLHVLRCVHLQRDIPPSLQADLTEGD